MRAGSALAALLCIACVNAASVSFVLVGATGNLAQKYLWQAVFENSLQLRDASIAVFAAATRPPGQGVELIKGILDASVKCRAELGHDCDEKLQQFKQGVSYVQLSKPEHYEAFGRQLNANAAAADEVARIFYLSISPSFYESTLKAINDYARPPAGQADLRVVLEKPFGHDYSSAKQLANSIATYLQESEIYRVDHYLGKPGMTAIAEFRRANDALLQRMFAAPSEMELLVHEVVMKETETVEGRTKFYDEVGVIKDVMQNHLTQAAVYLTMEWGAGADLFRFGRLDDRLAALKSLRECEERVGIEDPVDVGQYEGYKSHVSADFNLPLADVNSTAPTSSAVILCSRGEFVVMSAGKALDERRAFAATTRRSLTPTPHTTCSLMFNIQSEDGPFIQLAGECVTEHSDELASLVAPHGWRRVLGGRPDAITLVPAKYSSNAYVEVVKGVLDSDHSMFMSTEELLAQWNVWDPLLERTRESEQVIRYPLGHEGLHQDLLSRVQEALKKRVHARQSAAATTTNDEL